MVVSYLQEDVVFDEESGCGLISGLDCGTYPPVPMDFSARILIYLNGLEVRDMSPACPCAVQPVLPSLNITNATVSIFVRDTTRCQAGMGTGI
jgi:hypothetical protein